MLDLILANVRTPEVRRGDLRAQIAANRLAEQRLDELVERRGAEEIDAVFAEVIDYTERRTRDTLRRAARRHARRRRARSRATASSDDDIPIRVRVEIAGDELAIDFDGTAGAVAGNVNCPIAVTRSACLFALRVLLPPDVPANAGAFAPLDIRVPEGSLLCAQRPSAVVAGNVETSQRVADTVLLALAELVDGLPAQGQGTMNNLIIGGGDWTYYETIGGGQGAGPDGPGPSGVHVGMSNTLNTPIEALELEYPMRVERYELVVRLRRRRPPPRRRRHRARDPRARAGDAVAAHRPAAAPAGRAGGRRAGLRRGEPRRRRGAAAEGDPRARRGRRRARPHARRRGLRQAGVSGAAPSRRAPPPTGKRGGAAELLAAPVAHIPMPVRGEARDELCRMAGVPNPGPPDAGRPARSCGTYAGCGTRISPRSCSASASWIAFVAAPLSRLSPTTQRLSARGCEGSRRIRPTSTSSRPAPASAVG